MLYAFNAQDRTFIVSAKDEVNLVETIQKNLSDPHLEKIIKKYYKNGIVIVEANNLPSAAKKVKSKKELYIIMSDLPLCQDPGQLKGRNG